MRRLLAALLAFACLSAFSAEAAPIDRARSSVRFVSRQMGVPVKGEFGRFDADIHFDSRRPEKSRAAITIDLSSIDAGSEDATAEIMRRPWFDVKNHPKAEFASAALSRLGTDRYRALGRMTIKGVTRDVATDFRVRRGRGFEVFEGRFTLKRLDFGIGTGAWSDTSTVADEVEVDYTFAVPAKGE